MASFIMAGRMQAAIFIALSTLVSLLIPPLTIFTNAAVGLITLRQGWQQGTLFALFGGIILALISAVIKQDALTGLLAGLGSLLPIVLLGTALASSRSWEKTLQLVLITGSVGLLLFHLLVPDVESFWKPLIAQFEPALKQIYQLPQDKLEEYSSQIARWATGTFATAYTLLAILSLIIARHWQAMLYNPGGFSEEFRSIRIGKRAAIAFVAITVFALISSQQIAVEWLMLGIAVFMFQGLSLVHGLAKQLTLNPMWLFGLYVLMFLLLIQMIVLLATFGIIDNFADFRRKLANRTGA